MSFFLKFFTIVTPNTCKFVERFGRYHRRLDPGLNFLIPVYENASHTISLKEFTKKITKQEVITKDNINVEIEGVLYCKILDPFKATYNIEQPEKAIEVIAQSLLRCEIGKITLDSVLHERQKLNTKLLEEIKNNAERWGIICYRYEITNIHIDPEFLKYMNYEAESEREKRKLMLQATSYEITVMNQAEQKRMEILNKKKAEARSIYFLISSWINRVKVLKDILEKKESNVDILEMKLKNDLVKTYEELGLGDKNIFVRKDISNMNDIMSTVNLKNTKN